MVKKLIFQLSNGASDSDFNASSINKTLILNDKLQEFLKHQKNRISEHYYSKRWDKYKKFANNYELVFTSCYGFPSIANFESVSRSFFKLWEILYDFEDELKLNTNVPIHAAFLAEGPGGFLQAFTRYRESCNINGNEDQLFGVTLLSPNRNIPYWKLPVELFKQHNINLLKGDDGTGSLYNPANLASFIATIGAGSCNLITADGGFDFSNDFNNQEEHSMHLILCEIYLALQLQKERGHFVLKIYDIHTYNTMKVLYVLRMHYTDIYITKPLSSRPANSEKYIVCTGFKGVIDRDVGQMLQNAIQKKDYNNLYNIKPPSWFIQDLVYFNFHYIVRQAIHIHKTLLFIRNMNSNNDDGAFHKNLRHQMLKAIKWCNKYKIQVSLGAIKSYRKHYFPSVSA